MSRKIVFFDVDGTISSEETFAIPESTIKAMKRAQANGHIMYINTGRPASSIEDQIKALPIDGFVMGCGTHVTYHGKTILHHTIDGALADKIIQISLKTNVENVLEGANGTYYPEHLRNPMNIHFRDRYKSQGFPVFDYDENSHVSFDKMALWYFPDSDIETWKETFKDDLDYIQRDVDFIENVPKGYSKATGIKAIIDYLGIPLEDTISIGDSTNDLPMLEYTKESVAMGNANPAIFDSVSYITTDINDNGIWNALDHFGLL